MKISGNHIPVKRFFPAWLLPAAFGLIPVGGAYADIVFSDPQEAVQREPRAVAVGDLNGDGAQDAVVVNSGSDTIHILTGRGDGSLGAELNLKAPGAPRAVALDDFDGDGAIDMAVGMYGSSELVVFRGDGAGGFVDLNGTAYALSGRAQDVQSADVAGGPAKDLIVALDRGGEAVSVWVNDGSGNFTEDGVSVGSGLRFAVAAGDLDSDGDTDAVAAGLSSVLVLHNDDSGFTVAERVDTGANSLDVGLGDIDGDGDLDIVTADLSGSVSVARNRGDGRFGPVSAESLGLGQAVAVSVADMNGDGRAEILALLRRSTQRGQLHILSSAGPASFDETVRDIDRDPWAVRVAQMDPDATPDLVLSAGPGCRDGCLRNGEVTVLLNRGLMDLGGYRTAPVDEKPVALTPIDLDGDGLTDLAVANEDGNNVSLLRNRGDGYLEASGEFRDSRPVAIAGGDVDDDGDEDLIVGNEGNFTSLHRNNGDGSFSEPEVVIGNRRLAEVALSDMDGDGDADVVLLSMLLGGSVEVALNQGDGSFSSPTGQTTGDRPRAMALADIDGDGDQDVLTADEDERGMSILSNDGTAGLSSTGFVPIANSRPVAIASSDLDGDGDPDVVVGDTGRNRFHVFENQSGDFVLTSSLISPREVKKIALSDIDGDGHDDLVSTDFFDDTRPSEGISVRLGDGAGGFGPSQAYMAGSGTQGLGVAHFTDDGRPDIAVTDSMEDKAWVLVGGTGVASVDTDGDGVRDDLELALSLDPLDPDVDDDGLLDGIDPDLIGIALRDVPIDSFAWRGARQALIAQLNGVHTLITRRQTANALRDLGRVRDYYDGCSSLKQPDRNDWLADCSAQFTVQNVHDVIVSNLEQGVVSSR